MSYENKDTIQDSIIHYYDHVLLYNEYTDDVLEELDHVYTQAAKADEYEAKAKAFDRIVEERNRIGKLMHNKEYPQVFTDEAFWNIDDIINDTESGEYDAEKR